MNGPAFPQPPPLSGQPQKTEGFAIASLVLGIMSVLGSCFTGLPAIIFGHIARGRIERSGGTLGGSGMALGGLIMGYLFSFLGLLAIAASVFIPAMAAGGIRAKQIATLSQLKQIQAGLVAYRAEYGTWPVQPSRADAEDSDIAVQKALRGIDANSNPKKIVFAELSEKWIVADRLVDSWGNPLHFRFDDDDDGKVTVGTEVVTSPVAIWSNGRNGQDDNAGIDDIAVWKNLPRTSAR